jgi:hypothetical protein
MKRARVSIVIITIGWVFLLSLALAVQAQDVPPANAADNASTTGSVQPAVPSQSQPEPAAPEAGAAPTEPESEPAAPEAGAKPTEPEPAAPEAGAAPTEPESEPAAPEAGAKPAEPEPAVPEAGAAPTEPEPAAPEAGAKPAEPEPAAPEAGATPTEPESGALTPAAGAVAVPTTDYSGLWRALRTFKQVASGAFVLSVSGPRLAPTLPPPSVTQPSLQPTTEPLPAPQVHEPEGPRNTVLYGRPDEVYVLEKDGARRDYKDRELAFRNQPGFRLSDLPRPERRIVLYSEEEGAEPAPAARAGQAESEGQGGVGPAAETQQPRDAEGGEYETPVTGASPESEEAAGRDAEAGAQPSPESGAQGGAEGQPQTGTPKEGAPETGAPKNGAKEPAAAQQPVEGNAPPTARKSQKSDQTKPLSEAQKRAKQAKGEDVERIKEMRRQGVWFYNPDGTQMTNQQLDDRLASGSIEGVKAVDRYQSTWSAKDTYTPKREDAAASK